MKLAMAQMSMSPDIDENYQKTLKYIKAAGDSDLIFFRKFSGLPFSRNTKRRN